MAALGRLALDIKTAFGAPEDMLGIGACGGTTTARAAILRDVSLMW